MSNVRTIDDLGRIAIPLEFRKKLGIKEYDLLEITILNDGFFIKKQSVDGMAVSWSEFNKYGCVKCGCDYCYNGPISGGGSNPVTCVECGTKFVILADGLTESRLGFGDPAVFPRLRKHPRTGTPNHAYIMPDIRPEGEGEFFNPRGIGYDLAGFVKSKQAGERIIKMFEEVIVTPVTTWLDYRKNEPSWIQVKVQKEDVDLEVFYNLVKEDKIITKEKIEKSKIHKE